MKKELMIIFAILLILPLISAEIILNQQPSGTYNLGDTINLPITIKSPTAVSGLFEMNLLCEGQEINFYKNGVGLIAGEEKKMEASLILDKNVINELKGDCTIKGTFKDDYTLTNEFKISNILTIEIEETEEFEPGQNIVLKGKVTKENLQEVNGFIQLISSQQNSTENIEYLETINNGFFSINITLPSDMEAGARTIQLEAYEKDSNNEKTNIGFIKHIIQIKQIPTNLEIIFENQEIEPGTNLQVKAVLHDQTGENINTITILTIKNEKNKILEQTEITTDEFLEYPIAYNEPPAEWTIVAVSNQLTTKTEFQILEKKEIKIELINRTVTLTNIGNTIYNDTVLVKIGDESVNIKTNLKIDESQIYLLKAPDGKYIVEIKTDNGKNAITGEATLTGKAIEIKKVSSGLFSFFTSPFIWLFLIIILGVIAFIIFKKGYKKAFFGHIINFKKKEKQIPLTKNSIVQTQNKAELSLSIKGEKQNTSLVCLHIKNLKEIQAKKSSAEETLQEIVRFAEEDKAAIYENQNNLFFILAPVKTKTFKNERTSLDLAQKIKTNLDKHNKIAKQKISYGISLNYGTIIAKQEPESLKFMSMGTLISGSKKISSISNEEILLAEKINERLMSDVKTEKHKNHGVDVYTIKQIKQKTKENKEFIKNFVKRLEGKK